MRFGFLSEGTTPRGMTHHHRLHEVIREAELCEEMGWDFWGTSEQHFAPGATIAAPETLYGAVAMRTSRIKLRFMSILMLKFNHPIKVANHLATVDILSHGRVELCTARSNNVKTLDPFEVDPSDTRAQWREGLEVTVKALTEFPMEHHGEFYKIPPIEVTPRLYRDELFPIWVVTISPETHTIAGNMGLGAITNDSYLGWDYLEGLIGLYRDACKTPEPIAKYPVNTSLCFCPLTSHCAATREAAVEESRHDVIRFFRSTYDMYDQLDQRSGFEGINEIRKMKEHENDPLALGEFTPTIMIGTPDDLVERIKRLEAMGVDEIVLRIDDLGVSQHLKAIELIGKYVIPEFRGPNAIRRQSMWGDYGVEKPRFLT
ncbi:LLM class flavin-dependent oxidoreductase [Candidatus Poriferisodalis sp.]|uniref:LLM class flavin-dependent oxidoreductase n=1 Tax=Candidatus Poriferisodalis sp. TaxID=3101277 RepID=UPI003B596A85